jgi:demethylmenaquinone methyltransferase / 2-methoxy-6-polyprenyl-1,4-benzoquinol methylase
MASADLPHASVAPAAVAWDEQLLRNPHAVADKQRRVQQMFAAIAPSYDLNNRLHSLWMDQLWRRKAVRLSDLKATDRVVDVACGTGDLTLAYGKTLYALNNWPLSPAQIIGLDFTFEMLPRARDKAAAVRLYAPGYVTMPDDTLDRMQGYADPAEERWEREHPNSTRRCANRRYSSVAWLNGDAQRLPLPDACADVVSIAFGIRNVADPARAIHEFYRVLRPGGRLIILEFSLPTNPILRGLYNLYFRKILPRTATWISGDKTGAYKYLPESVNTFIGREQMTGMMQAAGFTDVTQHPMTFGVCVCYRGFRK